LKGSAPYTRRDDYRSDEAEQIMARKNFAATWILHRRGSPPRPRPPGILEPVGVSTPSTDRRLRDWEHSGDLDLAYGAARAHNRAMVEFCDVDPGSCPPATYLSSISTRAAAMTDEAIAMGAAAILVASGVRPPTRRATWGSTGCGPECRRAGIAVVFHVGGTGDLIDPSYFRNGLPVPPDFHGGEENSGRSITMAFPDPRPRPSPP